MRRGQAQSDEVIVSDHGGGSPQRVPVFGVHASWEINNVGLFSCLARVEDLRDAGLGFSLVDRWIEWNHAVLGAWGGVITARPVSNGIAEIGAEGWAGLLAGHMLLDFERPPAGAAGGLARRAVLAAGAVEPTYITVGMIDEGGDPVVMAFGGQDALRDVLMNLSSEVEWIVDQDRVFHAARRLGRDVSASVRLVEGRHILADHDIVEDVWADPPDEAFDFESVEETARRQFLRSWDSLQGADPQLGLVSRRTVVSHERWRDHPRRRKQGRRRRRIDSGWHLVPGGGASRASMSPRIPHWAVAPTGIGTNNPAIPGTAAAPLPTTPITLSIVNTDRVWVHCEVGNTVRIEIGSAGFAGRFRIMSRAVDANDDVLHVAGEALEDGA